MTTDGGDSDRDYGDDDSGDNDDNTCVCSFFSLSSSPYLSPFLFSSPYLFFPL